jgi:hypothetical protein
MQDAETTGPAANLTTQGDVMIGHRRQTARENAIRVIKVAKLSNPKSGPEISGSRNDQMRNRRRNDQMPNSRNDQMPDRRRIGRTLNQGKRTPE